MGYSEAFGLFLGAIALGAVHGLEPGHGWPVAASYALDQSNAWLSGFAASLLLGVGHLLSSIAMVFAFFYAKAYFDLTQANEPLELVAGVHIGGPVSVVAGVLLVLLGVREYRHGRDHGHGEMEDGGHGHGETEDGGHGHGATDGHDHVHSDSQTHHATEHSHHNDSDGRWSRLRDRLPLVGGHSHAHDSLDDAADRGLFGIAWAAFLLGFAHEEEFEIIALCAGSPYCLELMSAYAVTVVVALVGLTMVLVAGYQHHEAAVERYTPYLPLASAAVLVTMGLGFVAGVL
jgi:ABC-type nickel/cobalt efflux system permease component RcnA